MDLIKNYDRKRLLQNLCYVDENLMITQDVSKAVGFLDLISDTEGFPRFIINFFTPIGTARHWKDAMVMIKNWLDEKYKDHNLTKYLFEPALPMAFSVALCNENEFIHGKHIEATVYIPGFEKDESVGMCFQYAHKYSVKRRYDVFDYVSWFNDFK